MHPTRNKLCCRNAVCKTSWITPRFLIFLLLYFCAAPFATEAASQQYGKWQTDPATAESGESLTLSLKAEKEVKGWNKTSIPILTIQCSKGKAAVYIETGMALEVTVVDQQIVRVQFDDKKLVMQRWREIANATVSARDAAALVKELTQSQKFIFEFTPFGSPPAPAEFAVTGLSAYLPQLSRTCWGK